MTKTCKICGEHKEAVKGTWVMKHGKPEGRTCLSCHVEKQQSDRATPEGRLKANAAAIKCQARLVTSPRTGNLITAGSAKNDKHYTQSPWHELKKWVSDETRVLTWAIVNGTRNKDMRFQRLFGVTREEYQQHLLSQLGEHHLEDYQVTWQLDHLKPLALAQSSNDLMELARIENCQVLGMEAHAIKSLADQALIKRYEL